MGASICTDAITGPVWVTNNILRREPGSTTDGRLSKPPVSDKASSCPRCCRPSARRRMAGVTQPNRTRGLRHWGYGPFIDLEEYGPRPKTTEDYGRSDKKRLPQQYLESFFGKETTPPPSRIPALRRKCKVATTRPRFSPQRRGKKNFVHHGLTRINMDRAGTRPRPRLFRASPLSC